MTKWPTADDDTLRTAAKDVDDGWFTTEDGENVHMRYASDLPRRLNALRAALAASATDEGPRKRCTLECGHDGPHDSYSMWTDVPTVRPAVPALDVELGAPFWCYQHDRFCQYPIGPHRPAGAALTASATDEPSLDVERLTVALHGGDCVPNGLGLHIAGSEGAYCTLIAPAVARAYSVKAASATDEQTDPKG